MYNYDFQILQPVEFEDLTRDLLQKKEKVFVESFTMGRDGGIDLRFAHVRGKRGVVVQAKRYKDYRSLINVLKSEVEKVRKINPSRYILSTSVGLTPNNKDEILQLFEPFIKSTEDILGRNDLNNLLSQYPDVEKKTYKLWMGSSAVLESILNKRIENWSTMELEETWKTVSLYVMNDSFTEAERILRKNRYVIISGIPGIGKTTLARMLVFNILASGFDEFIKVNSMDEAAQKLTTGKKQVFMYDDFLGHSFLEDKESGFENKILSFIEKVKREPDKLFILSTREYILSSAKRQYEGFSLKNIELVKCTLDLSCYSESIRASILYNHLAMSALPAEYIGALLKGQQYLKLIKHKNFNPRIIEAFLNDKLYLRETPQGFIRRFLDFFDRPLSVWEFAYSKMSPLAKEALCVRATMGSGSVFLSDWYRATLYYHKGKYSNPEFTLEEDDWSNTVKDLLGTFISTSPYAKETVTYYNNPSVFDFVIDYIRQHKTLQLSLIKFAAYSNQITDTFTDKAPFDRNNGRLVISADFNSEIKHAFRKHIARPSSCKTTRIGELVYREKSSTLNFILDMLNSFPVLFRNSPELYSEYVTQALMEDETQSLYSRMQILNKIDIASCRINLDSLTDSILASIQWIHEFEEVLPLLDRTTKGRALMDDSSFVERIESVIEEELGNASSEEDCVLIRDSVESLSAYIPGLDFDTWSVAIDDAASAFAGPDPEYDDWDPGERADYYDMFSSLLVHQ